MSIHPGEGHVTSGEENIFGMPEYFQPSFEAADSVLRQVANGEFVLQGQVKAHAADGAACEKFLLGADEDFLSANDPGYSVSLMRSREGNSSLHRIVCIYGRTVNSYGVMTHDSSAPDALRPANEDELFDVASAISQIAAAYPEAVESVEPRPEKATVQRLIAKLLRRHVQ